LNNAFYCPPEDAVAFDQELFLPDLADRYGDFTAAVVVAHEWGHVVQERGQVRAPSVIMELQADCFAGAWVGRVADGDSDRFTIGTEELDQALAGILSLRDAPGSAADDPLAHGSGFDRVGAFQDGFEQGATRCAEYRNGDPEPFQWPFSAGEILTEGDLPLSGPASDPGIVELVFPSLDAWWTDTFPTVSGGASWDPLGAPVPFPASDPPACGGAPVEEFVLFVCIPDRFVGFEAIDTIPAAYEQNGDFAVATLFATQYGLDAVDQLRSASDEVGRPPSRAIASPAPGRPRCCRGAPTNHPSATSWSSRRGTSTKELPCCSRSAPRATAIARARASTGSAPSAPGCCGARVPARG
jgi:hypothetical protein